jgi:DNA-binding transcriptional LysR family regulator
MSNRLSGIEVFLQAVESGSFAHAAKRLHLSRSAVGKSISRLEERLGAPLVHRTTRRQTLTEDGQIFYERCARVMDELDAAVAELKSRHAAPRGRLRVSAPVLFGRKYVAPVLTALVKTYPELSVEMSFTDRVIDHLESGFDLTVRVGALKDSASLSVRRLGVQRMALFGAPDYLDVHGRPQCLDDLATQAAIIYERPDYDIPWSVRSPSGRIQDVRPDSRLRFDDLQAIADAAVAGAGIAWLPCWLAAEHVRTGALERILIDWQVLPTEIHVVWPKTQFMNSRQRVSIDALATEIPCRLKEFE